MQHSQNSGTNPVFHNTVAQQYLWPLPFPKGRSEESCPDRNRSKSRLAPFEKEGDQAGLAFCNSIFRPQTVRAYF